MWEAGDVVQWHRLLVTWEAVKGTKCGKGEEPARSAVPGTHAQKESSQVTGKGGVPPFPKVGFVVLPVIFKSQSQKTHRNRVEKMLFRQVCPVLGPSIQSLSDLSGVPGGLRGPCATHSGCRVSVQVDSKLHCPPAPVLELNSRSSPFSS